MSEEFASYARSEFELSARQEDGATLREHLEAVAARSGKLPSQLANSAKLPDGCAPLWRIFLHLHGRRGSSGFGPSPISYSEIDAYQRVTRQELAAWEINAIIAADDAYFASMPKPKAKPS